MPKPSQSNDHVKPYRAAGSSHGGYHYSSERMDCTKLLRPLVRQLQKYDALRVKLEKQGGTVDDLRRLTEILAESLALDRGFAEGKVSLSAQQDLKRALDWISWNLNLQVRRLQHTGMPVYYLCRTHHDIWGMHRLIVEDFYCSPGYPLNDRRFVRLMGASGHECFELRLSPFRSGARRMLARCRPSAGKYEVDQLLYRMGRYVFQYAWHEDQRLGLLVADHLKAPSFRHAIELLYLCLSGDSCELRDEFHQSSDPFRAFFEEIYPQPAIHRFFGILGELDGRALSDLPQRALRLYARLSQDFRRFLGLRVHWGRRQILTPLFKLVLGNASRLERIGPRLSREAPVMEQVTKLESQAREVIEELCRPWHVRAVS